MSGHPQIACSHDENRKKVCVACGNKIFFRGESLTKFLLSDKLIALLKKCVSAKFDPSSPKFPVCICYTCRKTLKEYEDNNFRRPRPMMPNFWDIQLAKTTRQNSTNNVVCNCFVCVKARFKGHPQLIKGRGKKRKF